MSWLNRGLEWLLSRHPHVGASAGLVLFVFLGWWLFSERIEQSLSGKDDEVVPQVIAAKDMPQQTGEIARRDSVVVERPVLTGHAASSFDGSVEPTSSLADKLRAVELETLGERIDYLLSDAAQLDEGIENWRQQVSDLAVNDTGRRIVNSAQQFPIAMTLVREELVPAVERMSLRKRVDVLDRQRKSKGEASSMESLRAAVTETEQLIAKLQETLDQASLALAEIEQQSKFLPPADQTLADAIAAHEKAQVTERIKRRQQQTEEAAQKLAENAAKNDAMRAKLEIEKQNAIALAEQERLKLEAEAARVRGIDDAARLRLAAEFDRELPQIQHYLGRLFESGYTQPMSPGHFGSVEKPGPVSLAAIKKVGALNDRVDGLSGAYAYFLTMMVTPTNDRQQAGPYPANYLGSAPTTEQAAAARPGYSLLKKYQTILVERGYLQP